jgi:hypothetical protein
VQGRAWGRGPRRRAGAGRRGLGGGAGPRRRCCDGARAQAPLARGAAAWRVGAGTGGRWRGEGRAGVGRRHGEATAD